MEHGNEGLTLIVSQNLIVIAPNFQRLSLFSFEPPDSYPTFVQVCGSSLEVRD